MFRDELAHGRSALSVYRTLTLCSLSLSGFWSASFCIVFCWFSTSDAPGFGGRVLNYATADALHIHEGTLKPKTESQSCPRDAPAAHKSRQGALFSMRTWRTEDIQIIGVVNI